MVKDIRLDNAKGILILSVVFGHLVELFIAKSAYYQALYTAIYLFHMPLFVMIAGMHSKAHLLATDYKKVVTKLVFPLIFFQILYLAFIGIRTGEITEPPLQPYWILWFLLSLITWRLALPLFVRIPFCIAIAFAIALAAGFCESIDYTLSLSRTLYFSPFFLIGHKHGKKIFAFAVAHRQLFALSFLLIVSGVAWWSLAGLPHKALYGAVGYSADPAIQSMPAVGRGVILVLSFAGACGALALFYFRQTLLIYLGQRSFTVFLLHGFAIKVLSFAMKRLQIEPSLPLLPALLAISLSIAVAASLLDPWLNRFFEAIGSGLHVMAQRLLPNSSS